MMIVIAMVGIMAAVAVPSFLQWRQDNQVRDAARRIADAFMIARSEAIRTGNRHIVAFGNDAAQDPAGNPINVFMPAAPQLAAVVYNEGPTAGANCLIDANETVFSVPADPTLNWGGTAGLSGGVNPAPNDNNPVPAPPGPNVGTSFTDPAGASVRWVVFRPDGVPVAFDAACNLGATGTGGGAVYFTNTRRDYAVVLSPLGGVRVHSWDPGAGAWRI